MRARALWAGIALTVGLVPILSATPAGADSPAGSDSTTVLGGDGTVLTSTSTSTGPAPAASAMAAPSGRPVLYLTFDDGPGPDTARFLDLLSSYGIRATFFVTGRNAAANPALARRIVADGHAIANHSWSHPQLTSLRDAGIRQELGATNDAVRAATGVAPACYRPPYGATSPRVQAQAAAVGLPNAEWTAGVGASHAGLWDIDTNDWRLSLAHTSWTEANMRAQLDRAGNGHVVLMHDGGANRGRGLRVLSQWLAANYDRFEFRSLPGCGGRLVEPPLDPAHPQDWHRFRIARLYRAWFGREPDAAGWEYWSKVAAQGRSMAEISEWFAQSSELALTAGALSDDQVVTLVYQRVLNREPDPDGHAYWVGQLARGLTRGRLMLGFSDSQEYVNATLMAITGSCADGDVVTSYRCRAAQLPIYSW